MYQGAYQRAVKMIRRRTIDYQAAACATFFTFLFFAIAIGIMGYWFQSRKEYLEDRKPALSERYEDHMYLNYAVAVGVAGSSIFYGFFLCMELHTAIFLRVILLVGSMCVYLYSVADSTTDEGIDQDFDGMQNALKDFDSNDWAAVSFALAWVFIAGFELNQSFYKQCGRITSKILFFLFYTFVGLALIGQGLNLMNDETLSRACAIKTGLHFAEPDTFADVVDCHFDPSLLGKIKLATGVLAALAAVAFLFYMCLDHHEPIKLNIILAILMVVTGLGGQGYQWYTNFTDWTELKETFEPLSDNYVVTSLDGTQRVTKTIALDGCDHWLKLTHFVLAHDIFMGLALITMVGFNAYFFETEKISQEELRGRGIASV